MFSIPQQCSFITAVSSNQPPRTHASGSVMCANSDDPIQKTWRVYGEQVSCMFYTFTSSQPARALYICFLLMCNHILSTINYLKKTCSV